MFVNSSELIHPVDAIIGKWLIHDKACQTDNLDHPTTRPNKPSPPTQSCTPFICCLGQIILTSFLFFFLSPYRPNTCAAKTN